MSTVLRVTGIAKRFGATIALDGVHLEIRAGEVHALIGENGAGKSTLMGVLAGAVRPDSGSMQLAGSPYVPATPLDARHAGIALIHQELSLCPHLSVAENVLLGEERARFGVIDRVNMLARARALLEELPHPEIHPGRKLGDLSLAARQIVEVCRALASNARVVLMDEPTSSLQGADVERLFALVRRLTARGIAVVYISHFLEEVRRIADRYTVLRNGLGVDTGAIASVGNDSLIASMIGREPAGLFPVRPRKPEGEIVLRVRDLAAPPQLQDASFELRRGEVLGIAGLLGSGRTELVRTIFGLQHATSGSVDVAGAVPVRHASPRRRLRQGFGYVSEDRKGEGLATALSITDNLCVTNPVLVRGFPGVLATSAQAAVARKWMTSLRIAARAPSQRVRALSGGNQQKVAIGRLLHQDATVLLLDEPTRGIDIGSKADVYDTISRRAGAGCAVVMVSSYLPELFGMCDRLAVMCRGRLSAARSIGDWTPEQVLATAIGEA